MSLLSDLWPQGKFESLYEYDHFMREINALVAGGLIRQIEPAVRGQWDVQADFFLDPSNNEIFVLHRPEFPSRGEWVKK